MYKSGRLVDNINKGGIMKKFTKLLFVSLILFLVVGCGDMMNTPTKKVETFLSKYQTLDEDVINQLDDVMEDANTYNSEQKEKYHELMKNQYKNLSYKIKDETQDGDQATVVVEIEVLDYGKAISDAETYLTTNRDEFVSDKTKDVIDTVKFLTYKIEAMSKVKEKVTYTINFTLTKEDGKWQLNDISDIDRLKLHGLYY